MRLQLTRFRRTADRFGIRLAANRQPHRVFDSATRRLLSPVLQNSSRNLSIDAAYGPHNKQLAAIKPMQRHRFIAAWLHNAIKPQRQRDRVARAFATHSIDAVRRCAAVWLEFLLQMSLAKRLKGVRLFAADVHFGMREIAWMARCTPP